MKLKLFTRIKKLGVGARIALSVSFLLLSLIIGLAVYARFNPEVFISTSAGRAVGRRMMRSEKVRDYVVSRADRFVTPATIQAAWSYAGVEDRLPPDEFGERMSDWRQGLNWHSKSPERKRENFSRLLEEDTLRYSIPVLTGIPESYSREIVGTVTDIVREYRENMTWQDRQELRNYLNSREGRELLSEAQRNYMTRLSAEEMQVISPLIDEIVEVVVSVLE